MIELAILVLAVVAVALLIGPKPRAVTGQWLFSRTSPRTGGHIDLPGWRYVGYSLSRDAYYYRRRWERRRR